MYKTIDLGWKLGGEMFHVTGFYVPVLLWLSVCVARFLIYENGIFVSEAAFALAPLFGALSRGPTG